MSSHGHTALAHHFDDLEQQHESASLGMWVFLVTEIMFFGGLFAGYTVYRTQFAEAFALGSNLLDIELGGINTAVLIGSSLTMAFAVRAAQVGKRKGIIIFLLLTMVLGAIFLGIKYVEYSHKFHDHLVPGTAFQYPEGAPRALQLFLSFYFAMTGAHALHMIIGIGILGTLVYQAYRGRYSPDYYAPVEMTGLYWHFVDIVWIFLFPLLYLLSRHSS